MGGVQRPVETTIAPCRAGSNATRPKATTTSSPLAVTAASLPQRGPSPNRLRANPGEAPATSPVLPLRLRPRARARPPPDLGTQTPATRHHPQRPQGRNLEAPQGRPASVLANPLLHFNVLTHRKHVEKLRYMHRNPVEQGLVDKPEDWPWSSFRHYLSGEPGRIEIESEWTWNQRQMTQAPTQPPQRRVPHS